MSDNRRLEFMHQNLVDLQRELHNHPELVELLQNHSVDDFELRMAEIATYCDVILDGDYVQADFDHLAGVLCKKLIQKRTGFIFPH